MSLHRSLKSADTMKRHRSVLSRLERTRILQEKGTLDLLEGHSVLGMPKVKHLKMRIRKEKAAAAAGAEGEAAAAGTAAAPAGAAAPAKGAPAKAAAPAAKAGAAAPAAKPKK